MLYRALCSPYASSKRHAAARTSMTHRTIQATMSILMRMYCIKTRSLHCPPDFVSSVSGAVFPSRGLILVQELLGAQNSYCLLRSQSRQTLLAKKKNTKIPDPCKVQLINALPSTRAQQRKDRKRKRINKHQASSKQGLGRAARHHELG